MTASLIGLFSQLNARFGLAAQPVGSCEPFFSRSGFTGPAGPEQLRRPVHSVVATMLETRILAVAADSLGVVQLAERIRGVTLYSGMCSELA
jgi:hypothetical protein